MSFDILLGCFFSSRMCVPSACHWGLVQVVVRACNHRNDLSDLFPSAFVNSQMDQADSLLILEPVVPVQSLRMRAGAFSFLAYFLSLKIEDKGKWRTSSSSDRAFDVVIKYLLKRYFNP